MLVAMRCVLVVEDEPIVRFTLAESLRTRNYEVDEANNGEKALSLLRVKLFDAVITDYRMPGDINGLDVLTYYHQMSPGNPKLLITALNGNLQTETEAIGGVYLRKPFSVARVVSILERALSNT
jgi:DNA-binding NtrC family response regulator